jgi:hypothetical protein
MPNVHKENLIGILKSRFGGIEKLPGSLSLFSLAEGTVRIYVRYSRVHEKRRAFFGLRVTDLRQLEGYDSYICFLTDEPLPPAFVPYADFEQVFRDAEAAADGQYKVQILFGIEGLELYVARQGKFNIEGYIGLEFLEKALAEKPRNRTLDLSHSQVQTLLAGIGNLKGHDVWVPASDAGGLSWDLAHRFDLRKTIPAGFGKVSHILCEIDVVWVAKGRNAIESLFEVEHSTTIYSGLLRFNDLLLTNPKLNRFSIVSDEKRRSAFARQLFRPTFRQSGLADLTSFLEYTNVYDWYSRLRPSSCSVLPGR